MQVDHAAGNVLNKGQAGAVTLLAYCDDMGPTIATPRTERLQGVQPRPVF